MTDKRTRAIQKRKEKTNKDKARDDARRKAKVDIKTGDSAHNLISELFSSDLLPLTDELFNELFSSGFPKNRSDFDYLKNDGFLFNPLRRSFVKFLEDRLIIEIDKDESRILDVNFLNQ